MVKGVSQRVVIVRPDDRGLFEQAIFLVRDHAAPRHDAVREACRIANSYLAERSPRRGRIAWCKLAAAFLLGALLASAAWVLLWMLWIPQGL
ncbi:MAG: hypothetical protein Q4D31_01625 [Eubacteriales bacterium]|nr:hypothetical protein [Eubacteriales bacterium]